MQSLVRALTLDLSLVMVLSLVVAGGATARADEVDVVQAAAKVIEARLPDRADHPALKAAAIRGMTQWLDDQTGVPGNAVLTEEEYRARQARLRGERFGLGIEFTVATGRGLLVTDVAAGSPAGAVGLVAGDLVIALDDRPFTGMAGPGIHHMVRELAEKAQGTPVVLDLRREGGALRRLEVVPGSFTALPGRVTRGDDRVVVRFDVIGTGAAKVVAGAIEEAGRRPLVLDLRDVSEGSLLDVVAVADLFLEAGRPVLRAVDPVGRIESSAATNARMHDGPLAVLVNRGTGGVAEALALTLRDHAGAALIGTRTAGVASHPSFHPIGDGMVLQLADTALLSGEGASWATEGLEVDLLVQPVQIPLVGPARAGFPDMQLEAALRYLAAP